MIQSMGEMGEDEGEKQKSESGEREREKETEVREERKEEWSGCYVEPLSQIHERRSKSKNTPSSLHFTRCNHPR